MEISKFLSYDEISDIKNGEPKISLSDKAKLNISVILDILHDDIFPFYNKVLKNNSIADVKILASKIHSLAAKYEVELLEKYATEFYDAVDTFDILKMQKLLNNFSDVEKELV
jgi:hypothetical protein